MHFSVLKSASDNDILYSAKEIDINGTRINTPCPLLTNNINHNEIRLTTKNHFYELWKTFDISTILKLPYNNQEAIHFNQIIRREIKSFMQTQFKIYFLSISRIIESNTNPFSEISDNHINFVLDSLYLNTDIVTFPIIRDIPNIINNKARVNDYLDFINHSYEIAETLNNKPIMAIIPPIPQNFIGDVVNNYLKLDISIFCFDFNGFGLNTLFTHYKEFLRTLYRFDPKSFNQKLIYVLNLRLPTNRNLNQPFPADDMIIPTFGSDFLGINHVVAGAPSPRIAREGRTPRRQIQRINLLDTNAYLYHRISNLNEFNDIFTSPLLEPNFQKIANTPSNLRNEFRRKFNYTQKNQEFSLIHEQIMKNEEIVAFLNEKEGIDEDSRRRMRDTKNYLNQTNIRDFFS